MSNPRRLFVFSAMFLSVAAAAPAQDPVADAAYAAEYESRRAQVLEAYAATGAQDAFNDAIRLATGRAPQGNGIPSALNLINNRIDTADFRLPPLLYILYRHSDDPNLPQATEDAIRDALLNFKYWPDEGGEGDMIHYTENHYILFASGAYLAGQLYPDETFTNSGLTCAELSAVHRARIMRWLNLRFRTGFWEWLSNIYYNEDLAALMALIELAEDPELAARATIVADLLFLDKALNSYEGVFGSTHGRSEDDDLLFPMNEGTREAMWLAFGLRDPGTRSKGASMLALADNYRVPRVIHNIANDKRPEMLNRQRISIRIEDGPEYGIGYANLEDGMIWLTMNALGDPLTANLFIDMMNAFNWWENSTFSDIAEFQELLQTGRESGGLPFLAETFKADLSRSIMDEVNVVTYRTPDYMLSTAVDWKPGFGGQQQHIWQATLSEEAVCFTTHPGALVRDRPGYWTGNGWLPRAGQWENVAICIYEATDRAGLFITETPDFTHAWLPRDFYDEFVERDGWFFGREGDGYLAFYSQHPGFWQTNPGNTQGREYIVPGRQNIYICELGRAETDGSFEDFQDAIVAAPLSFDGLSVSYDSPSQGPISFEWRDAITAETAKQTGDPFGVPFPRFDNPFAQAAFGSDTLFIQRDNAQIFYDWDDATRSTEITPPAMPLISGMGAAGLTLALGAAAGRAAHHAGRR